MHSRPREARVQLAPGRQAGDDELQAAGGGPARVPGGAEGGGGAQGGPGQ